MECLKWIEFYDEAKLAEMMLFSRFLRRVESVGELVGVAVVVGDADWMLWD